MPPPLSLAGATDEQLCELFLGPGSYLLSAPWQPLEMRFGSGFLDVANLDVGLLDAEACAVAMGRDPRWGGHSGDRVVSVLEHSIVVGDLVRRARPRDIRAQLAGYLHDLPESLLRDMQSPFKHRREMWFYRCLERRVAARQEAAFGLSVGAFESEAVKRADEIAWICEMRDLDMGPEGEAWAADRCIDLPAARFYPIAPPDIEALELRWLRKVAGLCRELGVRPAIRGFL
jgi:hypothetical protein